ncbi:MAG TPA: NAD(+)/NADH kinase [Syntrophales bacterium]|nr:NAD(+)/NADH kinase [Syntrophales bacterium]HOL58474.1 NAD(+)/NADH kinase [Syntrophales bacterium]HPO34918.1 NAD(+)/NADH kinase [Syntrophales bacterium]
MKVEKVGIIANVAKENASFQAGKLRDWLKAKGVKVYLHRELAATLREKGGYEIEELSRLADLLTVMGGDGTILRAARGAKESPIPILGINLGQFGYLAEVNLGEMYDTFSVILTGQFQTEERMMLDVKGSSLQASAADSWTILNDAVINRGNLSRIVEIETFVDGAYLTTFKADGLIISTPTGSTAYSLSAGGPIVFPRHDSIIINPICPHTLTNRPIILPGSARITITLHSKEEGATLTLDGQVLVHLKSGDTVEITRSPYVTVLVVSPHRHYFEILRTKLGWGGMPAALNGR